ncbi:hypothetical protein PGT21_016232 [Puccinia graminis f. sp. tritici]|uniref:Uncharacterized protein n=1 Tax=Puccinia graminis f. sp. tritici TaxID=56615 RepID=A0A5B0LXN0_PUCGR|nr:hypothetical protein PGT21_016232 [Puccinia graminis f. sp. tritici]
MMKIVYHSLLYALFIQIFLHSVKAGCSSHPNAGWYVQRVILNDDGTHKAYVWECKKCRVTTTTPAG